MKKGLFILTAFALSLLTNSCNEDEISFSGEADVFTLSHYNQDGMPQFANAFYVYGNKTMDNAVVTTPQGNTVELISNGDIKSTYFLEPREEDYSASQPMPGDYEFEVTTDGNNVHLLSDQLESNFIMPVNITEGYIEDNILKVKWDKNEEALAYVFRVMDESQDDQNVLLSTGYIDTDSIEANLSTLNFNSEMPVSGQEYSLEVRAYKFESDQEVNLEYNIQAVSSAKKPITWE